MNLTKLTDETVIRILMFALGICFYWVCDILLALYEIWRLEK